ncbi:MAG: tetratricopeptide repeat protein [Gammaproteobacteria bacterium]|nr:tetratricopeptide repeat protein [Gammaproteobacteria bacterium]
MLKFYCVLATLLFIALAIIMIPFVRAKKTFTIQSTITILFVTLFTSSLYFIFGNSVGLNQWLKEGKQHYQLLTEVNQLGGIDAIIKRIQQRLKANPNDLRGWIILSKIFISEGRSKEARNALQHAQKLDPNNSEVKQLSQTLKDAF